MAFLNRYLAQKLIYDNHPALDKAHCIRSIQTRHECTACRDICPSRVFDGADLRTEGANGVGVSL